MALPLGEGRGNRRGIECLPPNIFAPKTTVFRCACRIFSTTLAIPARDESQSRFA